MNGLHRAKHLEPRLPKGKTNSVKSNLKAVVKLATSEKYPVMLVAYFGCLLKKKLTTWQDIKSQYMYLEEENS